MTEIVVMFEVLRGAGLGRGMIAASLEAVMSEAGTWWSGTLLGTLFGGIRGD